jgi:hypothetical protein
MIGSSSRDIHATVDVEIPGRPVATPLTVWSTFRSGASIQRSDRNWSNCWPPGAESEAAWPIC